MKAKQQRNIHIAVKSTQEMQSEKLRSPLHNRISPLKENQKSRQLFRFDRLRDVIQSQSKDCKEHLSCHGNVPTTPKDKTQREVIPKRDDRVLEKD